MSDEMPYYNKDFATLVDDLMKYMKSPDGGRSPLSDVATGSVVLTLVEAFARELAVCYEQLHKVYRYGYLETAEGVALDNVVALLGISRQQAGHLEGSVTFSRQQQSAFADSPIPAGTLVAGSGIPLFETVGDALLRKDDLETTVSVRAVEPGGEPVPAGKITVMPRPISGIDRVTNPIALVANQQEETDEKLRERARGALRRSRRGTKAAMEEAVKSLGIPNVEIPKEDPSKPGQIEVILKDPLQLSQSSATLLDQIRDAVEEVRPAGILVTVQFYTYVLVDIEVTLAADQPRYQGLEDSIREKLEAQLKLVKNRVITYKDLYNSLLIKTKKVIFKTIHDRDGRVIILDEKGNDTLTEWEQSKVGEVLVSGGFGG